jgi:AAHS family 4-hydroxybenzoate transporter-like MFS transporter
MSVDVGQLIEDRTDAAGMRRIVVILMTIVMVIDGLDLLLLPFASPLILTEWHITKIALSPAMGGALIGMALGTLLGGALGDRFGRRAVLTVAVGLFGVATLACAAVGNVTELTTMRIVAGLGFGACFPNATALVAEWTPRSMLSRTVGFIFIGVPFGGVVGGAMAITVLPIWGWRGLFVLGGLLSLGLCVTLIALLPESPRWLAQTGRHVRLRLLMLRAFPKDVWDVGTTFATASAASNGSEGSVRVLTASNMRVNISVWTAFFMNMLAGVALISWSPVILTSMGMSVQGALAGSITYSCAAIAGTLLATTIGARLGTRVSMLSLSAAAALVAIALLTLAGRQANVGESATAIAVGITLMGGCLAGLQAMLWVLAANAYATECRATGVAIASSVGRGGAVIGSIGAGSLLTLLSPTWFFAVVAFAFAAVGLCVLALDRHVAPEAAT